MIPISNRKWKGVVAAITRAITAESLRDQLSGLTEYQRYLMQLFIGRKYF